MERVIYCIPVNRGTKAAFIDSIDTECINLTSDMSKAHRFRLNQDSSKDKQRMLKIVSTIRNSYTQRGLAYPVIAFLPPVNSRLRELRNYYSLEIIKVTAAAKAYGMEVVLYPDLDNNSVNIMVIDNYGLNSVAGAAGIAVERFKIQEDKNRRMILALASNRVIESSYDALFECIKQIRQNPERYSSDGSLYFV